MAVDISEIKKYQNAQTFLSEIKLVDLNLVERLGRWRQFSKSDAVQCFHLNLTPPHLVAHCVQQLGQASGCKEEVQSMCN